MAAGGRFGRPSAPVRRPGRGSSGGVLFAFQSKRERLFWYWEAGSSSGFMPVSVDLGATPLTVIPRGPRSRESPFVRPVIAALLAAEAAISAS